MASTIWSFQSDEFGESRGSAKSLGDSDESSESREFGDTGENASRYRALGA